MINRFKDEPTFAILLGFLLNILIGTFFISMPFCHTHTVSLIDNLFSIVSAISTTGLTTISVFDNYSFWGQLVLVIMFQMGGWGFMTITSFFFIILRKDLSENRVKILNTSYSLPRGFNLKRFVFHIMMFTLVIEIIGIILLWWVFSLAGKPDALWSAIFHTISAFATAGFSLYNNSLTDFSLNIPVNIIISVLCYMGAIGFIVIQDIYLAVMYKKKVTFTSKVIVFITGMVYVIGTILFFFTEPSLQGQSLVNKFMLSSFQVMTASTTAGFNTMDLSLLSRAAMFIIIVVMIIGASPSGTGGGIKTTSVSALTGVVTSVVRKRNNITFFHREIPLNRVFTAVASTTVYLSVLSMGVFALLITEQYEFEKIFFEVASALGTVGLSTGITSSLTSNGKVILILLMYIGRVGPLTIGASMFGREMFSKKFKESDLAV